MRWSFCYFKKIDDWVNKVSLMLVNHEWTLGIYDNLMSVVGNIYELFEL